MSKVKQRFFIYDRREVVILIALAAMVAVFGFTLGVHLGIKQGQSIRATDGDSALLARTQGDAVPGNLELMEQRKGVERAQQEALNQELQDEVAKTGVKLDQTRQINLPKKAKTVSGGATTMVKPEEELAAEEAARIAEAAQKEQEALELEEKMKAKLAAERKQKEAEQAQKTAENKVGETPSKETAQKAEAQAGVDPKAEAQKELADKKPAQVENPESAPMPKEVASEAPKAETVAKSSSGSGEGRLLTRATPRGRFTLQVGSYPSVEEALQQAGSLEKSGVEPFLRKAQIKGKGEFVRVYVGGYPSIHSAKEQGEQFVQKKVIDSFFVAKMP